MKPDIRFTIIINIISVLKGKNSLIAVISLENTFTVVLSLLQLSNLVLKGTFFSGTNCQGKTTWLNADCL